MKRIACAVCLLFCLSLGSCQCADPPEIGPVEEEDTSAAIGFIAPAWQVA